MSGSPEDSSAPGMPARRARRWLKPLAFAAVGVLLLCCCGGGATSSYLLGGFQDDKRTSNGSRYGCGRPGVTVNLDRVLRPVAGLNAEQMHNAAVIVQVGQQLGIPARGWVIATATAYQESTLYNLNHGDRDSVGLFQQRPSMGWGTVEQIMNPVYSSQKFYEGLKKVDGWAQMALWRAAQLVQKSQFPFLYGNHETLATEVVNELTGGGARAVGNLANLQCTPAGEISASGWTIPLKAPVVSGFRTLERPDHNGIDFGAARGTEIHAVAAGRVVTMLCNVAGSNTTTGVGCEHDGSPSVSGCGWYVDIEHANGFLTRYCHMNERPRVEKGQQVAPGDVIGAVGSTGNSSGPHLHFEVHTGGGQDNASAVDPMQFMRQVGAPLDGAQ